MLPISKSPEASVFERAFRGKREPLFLSLSSTTWRPRCGRRLRRRIAESQSHRDDATSSKTLSGHLRSRLSVRSVTNFPGLFARARLPPPPPFSSTPSSLVSLASFRAGTRARFGYPAVILVLIKRGWMSTWRKLISASSDSISRARDIAKISKRADHADTNVIYIVSFFRGTYDKNCYILLYINAKIFYFFCSFSNYFCDNWYIINSSLSLMF